jgi:hypothetical protein
LSNDSTLIYTVHVDKRTLNGTEDDEYEIPAGKEPEFETTDDGELWIQAKDPEENTVSFVAVYSPGSWARCWMVTQVESLDE